MSENTFPRAVDTLGHAWGLSGGVPIELWERFSLKYEARLELLVMALEQQGYAVTIGGAGSEDGEYIHAIHSTRSAVFQHLEDPSELDNVAELLASLV